MEDASAGNAVPSYLRLKLQQDGDTLRISFARPDKLNAFDAPLVEETIAALNAAARDGVRLVVFTGEGRGFSGGFDFTGFEDQSDGDLALRFIRIEHLLQSVHYAPFMTMALVHGACFGAAADLVASCTWRVADPGARFRMPGLMFGVTLGTRRLGEAVGRDNAVRLLAREAPFQSEEALRCRLLTEIAPQEVWPDLVVEKLRAAEALPREGLQSLLCQTRADQRDADLAELARSVTTPGLKSRIAAYRAKG